MRRGAWLLLAFAVAPPLAAQDEDTTGTGLPVTFRGELGTTGELYGASGRDARRPSATGELFFRSSVTLFGRITTAVDILFSSEDGAGLSGTPGVGRQRLNRLGLTPSWTWGRAYLGSFTDAYSEYTFNGIRVTGAGFAVNPGVLRLASVYGVTDQAVLGGATDGSYRRRLAGGRIGVGRGEAGGDGSYLDVMLLRAWDDETSLPLATDPLAPEAGVPVNSFAVTPEENVVVGAAGALQALRGSLRLGAEASGAMHSRDRRAPVLDEETLPSYPGLLRGLLTPRVSTHADYAYRFDASYRIARLPGGTPRSPRTLDLAGEYSYIGPGYVSLGLASLPADQRAVGLRTQVRFPRWTVGLNGRLQHDNLLGQKLATTDRSQLGVNVTLRPMQRLTLALRGSLLDVANDSQDSLRQIAYASRTLGVSNTFALGGARMVRSVSLSYGYQDAGDDHPLRAAGNLVAHNADVRVGFSPSRMLQITPSIGIVRAKSGAQPWSTRESYALSATTRLFDGRWNTTAAVGASRASPNRSTRASLSSEFQITDAQSVSLRLSTNQFRNPLEEGSEFREYTVSLRVVRRLQ